MATTAQGTSTPRLLAYLQLFRLPNVFTAIADVLMGFIVTHGSLQPWQPLVLLVLASSLIYTAGMVLNDVYDVEIDAKERPNRPLPSGRIGLAWARWLGFEMLVVGVACSAAVSYLAADIRPVAVATALAALVVAYDKVLKHTPLGPLAMGSCRFLNVLLGMSAANEAWGTAHLVIAAGVGVYILGVTLFAKNEADTSRRVPLALAAGVMLSGLALLAWYPSWFPPDRLTPLVRNDPGRWQLMWLMLGFLIGFRLARAIADPTPRHVQIAIKQSIISLIILDAAVAFAASGMPESTVILALLLPAMFLGRWVYST